MKSTAQSAILSVRRTVVVGMILFWALMIAVAVQDYERSGGREFWKPVFWESSSALVTLLIFWLQWPLLNNQQLRATPRLWFLRLLLYQPLVCVFFVCVVFAIRHAVYAAFGSVYTHVAWPQVFIYESIKLTFFYGIFYSIFFGVEAYTSLLTEKEKAAETLALLQQAQMQRLAEQIQPHFLFNALNTISSLMYSDLKAADKALTRLSELLRASLALSGESQTSLSQEIELLRAYAELMQARFIDRVTIEWELDTAAKACKVPVMCLQPILENTFKHVVEKRSTPTHICIRSRLESGFLILSVEDDAGSLVSQPTTTEGIGLANIRQRIEVLYADQASLRLEPLVGAGVKTTLRIPLDGALETP